MPIAKPAEIKQMFFQGETHRIELPSGKLVSIRETNGNDDEVLSRLGNSEDGTGVYQYLSNIIINDSDKEGDDPITLEDLKGWKLKDKYYLMFKQRLINFGNEYTFEFQCKCDRCKKVKEEPKSLTEDLSELENSFTKLKYPFGKQSEVEVTIDNYKFKFDIRTGKHETSIMLVPDKEITQNHNLYNRNLCFWYNESWVQITNFMAFSSKTMVKLRKYVNDADSSFNPVLEFNAEPCGTPYSFPLLSLATFFFPEQI